MATFKAVIDAIVSEATYQTVLRENEGLSASTSRLSLLLQDRGLDTARCLFASVLLFEVESGVLERIALICKEIHAAETARRLIYLDGASAFRPQRKFN